MVDLTVYASEDAAVFNFFAIFGNYVVKSLPFERGFLPADSFFHF